MNNELNYLYEVAKNDLEYLFELTEEDVKGFYFLDYMKGNHNNSHRKYGWLKRRDIAVHSSMLDWDEIDDFRVQRYTDLIEPVNKDGQTYDECQENGIVFIPTSQKIEYLFGDDYRITHESLEKGKTSSRYEYQQTYGCMFPYDGFCEQSFSSGILVMDREGVITSKEYLGWGKELSLDSKINALIPIREFKDQLQQIVEKHDIEGEYYHELLEDLLSYALKGATASKEEREDPYFAKNLLIGLTRSGYHTKSIQDDDYHQEQKESDDYWGDEEDAA